MVTFILSIFGYTALGMITSAISVIIDNRSKRWIDEEQFGR